jgi:hypothetical protein
MKKYLPIILFILGIIVVAVVFFILRGRGGKESVEREETALIEVALEDRPIVSLTPTDDGHYLNLRVGEINIPGAETMEYELLYDVPGGVTQGVPGMVEIKGLSSFEAELLLGSESSGKFRYDEGVEEGMMTIRFRNKGGKLLIKFVSDFRMQSGDTELTTFDGKFKYDFDETPDGYFVTMHTIGFPGNAPDDIKEGPYGVFSSSSNIPKGEVSMDKGNVYLWEDGDWKMLEDKKSDEVGIFILAS